MMLSLLRPARMAVGLIGIALFLVFGGLSLLTHVAPLMGHHTFIIGGGSMEPSIPIGSLVLATATDPDTVVAGDILTIRADSGVVVTHRVIRAVDLPAGRSFEMRGDANRSADGGLVPADAIVGAVSYYIPYAGYVQAFLSTTPGLIAALSILATLYLAHLLLGLLGSAARVPADSLEPVAR